VFAFGTGDFTIEGWIKQNNTSRQDWFVLGNTANNLNRIQFLYDGTNVGYFNNSQISRPQPDSYVNKIETGTKQQAPFKLLNGPDYSKIEEIFSVFDKSVLDKFENEFLNFCKPVSNIDLGPQVAVPIGVSPADSNALFKNFQYLFRRMMEIEGKLIKVDTHEFLIPNNGRSAWVMISYG
jgi:hypothetical protein